MKHNHTVISISGNDKKKGWMQHDASVVLFNSMRTDYQTSGKAMLV